MLDVGVYFVIVSNQYGSVTSTVAKLNVNLAALDLEFKPQVQGLNTLAVQTDGKNLLIGGALLRINGQDIKCIGRLNSDGKLDNSFILYVQSQTGYPASFNSMVLQPDGKILVGGHFDAMGTPLYSIDSIARLNQDGTLDKKFISGAGSFISGSGYEARNVYSLALQANEKILVGGDFNELGVQSNKYTWKYIGRLNEDGTVDQEFNPIVSGFVHSIAVQTDDKILIGGDFHTINNLTRAYIAMSGSRKR